TKRQSELDAGHGVHQRFVDVLHRLDEMRLAEDEVDRFGLLDLDRSDFGFHRDGKVASFGRPVKPVSRLLPIRGESEHTHQMGRTPSLGSRRIGKPPSFQVRQATVIALRRQNKSPRQATVPSKQNSSVYRY